MGFCFSFYGAGGQDARSLRAVGRAAYHRRRHRRRRSGVLCLCEVGLLSTRLGASGLTVVQQTQHAGIAVDFDELTVSEHLRRVADPRDAGFAVLSRHQGTVLQRTSYLEHDETARGSRTPGSGSCTG